MTWPQTMGCVHAISIPGSGVPKGPDGWTESSLPPSPAQRWCRQRLEGIGDLSWTRTEELESVMLLFDRIKCFSIQQIPTTCYVPGTDADFRDRPLVSLRDLGHREREGGMVSRETGFSLTQSYELQTGPG